MPRLRPAEAAYTAPLIPLRRTPIITLTYEGDCAMPKLISRRHFIQSAGIATAAFLAQPRARAGEFTGKIKKAVKFNMIQEDLSVADKFRLLQNLGYDGVEMGFRDEADPTEVVAARDRTGLPIHGVVLGSVDGIELAVDRAKLYGASSVLIVAGRVDEKMPYADNYPITQYKIRSAIAYAERHEIMLLLENVWNNFLLSPLEMARYIDEIGSPWVQVYFDVGNVVRFAWPEHWIPVLGSRIKKLDIKEYSRDKQNNEGLWKGFDVPIGEGSIDWAAVRRELRTIGFSGWATAEVNGGDRNHLADVAARMDRVLDLA